MDIIALAPHEINVLSHWLRRLWAAHGKLCHQAGIIVVTKQNVDLFRKQLKRGFFLRYTQVNTTDPAYKWTQFIFLKLFEHGQATSRRCR